MQKWYFEMSFMLTMDVDIRPVKVCLDLQFRFSLFNPIVATHKHARVVSNSEQNHWWRVLLWIHHLNSVSDKSALINLFRTSQ